MCKNNKNCSGNCNKCKQGKTVITIEPQAHIPCPDKKEICSHESPCFLGCQKCKPLCNPEPDKCEEPCEEHLFDTKEIAYKVNCDDFSKLDRLGIKKGTRLERILEIYGEILQDINYINTPKYKGNEFKSQEAFFTFLIQENEKKEEELQEYIKYVHKLENLVGSFNERLKKLEYPEIQDLNGLDITKSTSLQEVIQILTINTNPL